MGPYWSFDTELRSTAAQEPDSQLEQWLKRVIKGSPLLLWKLNETEAIRVKGTYVSRTMAKLNVNLKNVGTLAEL